jgi:hypothetical protein
VAFFLPKIGLLREVQMKRRKTFSFFHSSNRHKFVVGACISLVFALLFAIKLLPVAAQTTPEVVGYDDAVSHNAQQMLAEGKQTFRFDTVGSEVFWGDTLKLHEAVAQQTLKKLQPAKLTKQKKQNHENTNFIH